MIFNKIKNYRISKEKTAGLFIKYENTQTELKIGAKIVNYVLVLRIEIEK